MNLLRNAAISRSRWSDSTGAPDHHNAFALHDSPIAPDKRWAHRICDPRRARRCHCAFIPDHAATAAGINLPAIMNSAMTAACAARIANPMSPAPYSGAIGDIM